MNTLILSLLGAGIGLGIYLLLAALIPGRRPLADALAAPHHSPAPPRARPTGFTEAAGTPATQILADLGLPGAKTRADLRALGLAPERHLAQKAGLALSGLVLFPAFVLVLAIGGIHPPGFLLIAGTLVFVTAGFTLPDRQTRADAEKLRDSLRYATSAFLDLAATMLAAGAGLEEALTDASTAGAGPGHDRLRAALGAAATTRTPLWDALHQLGETTGVTELTELAASASLAGTEGARIRSTLTAKAASTRGRLLAAAEAHAASATERMALPTVILMTGFLLFVGYPAMVQVLTGL